LQAALTAAGLGAFAAPVQLHAAAAKGTHGNWMATVHENGGLHLARMDEYHSATGTVETTAVQPARGAVAYIHNAQARETHAAFLLNLQLLPKKNKLDVVLFFDEPMLEIVELRDGESMPNGTSVVCVIIVSLNHFQPYFPD
jgi:hypothetical protein